MKSNILHKTWYQPVVYFNTGAKYVYHDIRLVDFIIVKLFPECQKSDMARLIILRRNALEKVATCHPGCLRGDTEHMPI